MKKVVLFSLILLAVFFLALVFIKLYKGKRILGISTIVPDFPEGYEIASWLWASPTEFNPKDLQDLMDFCKREKINTIYLRIDDYINITELENKNLRKQKEVEFNNAIQRFLEVANEYDIKIHALAGHPSWSEPSLSYIPVLLADYVIKFNKSKENTIKFDGIQFDIEFYNQENFKNNKDASLLEYLELINNLVGKISTHNKKSDHQLRFGLAIPYWFDKDENKVMWKGKDKQIAYHLIDILDQLPGSYLAIMAYRDSPRGKNGSINISKDEIIYAQNNTQNISIIVGQEVDNTEEKRISFFNKGKSYFKRAVIDIISEFSQYQVFKGIAVHDLLAYKIL